MGPPREPSVSGSRGERRSNGAIRSFPQKLETE
nr:MAG TPA: hypothetical protein [Caudoviricetes sp.]